jgi:RimJ/RimL family protein N-acetyltransferase
MGVDPSRLLSREAWRKRFDEEFAQPLDKRQRYVLAWLCDGQVVGFSSCDRIVFGDRANMHLHVFEEGKRRTGIGAPCVKQSVEIYFERFRLKRLFCEPNALNVAPNRTLAKAGFTYVKTYMTVPGPINVHQPVTQWLIER